VTVRGGGRNRATAAQLTGEEGAGPVGQRAGPRCGGGLRPAHEKGRVMRRVFHDGCDDGKTEDRGGSLTYERRWRRQGRTRGTFPSFKEARLGSKMGWSGWDLEHGRGRHRGGGQWRERAHSTRGKEEAEWGGVGLKTVRAVGPVEARFDLAAECDKR
jgi:hypothetical protein